MNCPRRFVLPALLALSISVLSPARADDTIRPGARFESLPAGKVTYQNVVVRSVSVHSVVISHAGGMASVLLRDLAPEWQARFHYDPAADAAAEAQANRPPAPVVAKPPARSHSSNGESGMVNLLQQFGHPATVLTDVDLRPKFYAFGLGGPDNQGRRPSCAIFAVVTALEFENAMRTGRGQKLSEEYLIWATRKTVQRTPVAPAGGGAAAADDADDGFSLTEVVNSLRAYGIPLQSSMPTNLDRKITEIADPPAEVVKESQKRHQVFAHELPGRDPATRINNLVHALNAGVPVPIGLAWPNYRSLRNGYLSAQKPMQNAWHAVTLIGYHCDTGRIEDTYFIFKNSWGKEWGQDGCGTVTYRYLSNNLVDAVLLEVQPG
jgi:hypothetical protein